MDGFTQSERKNAVYIMASFVAMFCWYTAYFREIDESPVMRLLQARGVNGDPWAVSFVKRKTSQPVQMKSQPPGSSEEAVI